MIGSTAVVGVLFATSALVALALAWSGAATYVDLVGATHAGEHEGWIRYVTGRGGEQPTGLEYTADERLHMDDVRRVFVGAQAVAIGALGVLAIALARRRSRRDALLRDGALAAGVAVGAVGLLGAVAFEPLFLLFHAVFFPQGNFLFPPGSRLLAVYPERYFYGLTIRVALSFIALVGLTAAIAQANLRGSRGTAR